MTAQPDGDAPVAWLPATVPARRLPAVDLIDGFDCPGAAAAIRQAMAAQLGLDGHVLCHLVCRLPNDGGPGEQVAVVEAASASLPPEWRGIAFADIQPGSFAVPKHLDLVARWLRSSSPGAVPPQRVAWARPGWRARAEAWISQQLAALGVALTGPITTQKLWSISAVLRVPTTAGEFYLKAVPPLFGREPALTDALARRHPGQVPEVVALDTAQGWMLMRAFAGSDLHGNDDLALWEKGARAYARLQLAWRDDLDNLRRLGCPDRGPLFLAEKIDDLLADEALMRVGEPRGLTAEQLADLRALAPRLKAACVEWAVAGVPVTLEHGDFHDGNIAVNGDQMVVFDWTDGCIGHPFVCLAALMENAKPEWRAALTDAYLEPWRDLASAAQIDRALRLSRVLGPLHMALGYYDIHHAAEPLMQWQLDGGGPYFLREVLKNQGELMTQSMALR